MDNGKLNYEAYREEADGRCPVTGGDLPEWEDLPALLQAAFSAGGDAVYNATYEIAYEDGMDAGLEEAEEEIEVEELEI